MNPYLKILLLVLAAIVALKLLPVTLALGCLLGLLLAGLVLCGLSVAVITALATVALAAVLAPVWIPVLVILALVALIKKVNRPPSPA